MCDVVVVLDRTVDTASATFLAMTLLQRGVYLRGHGVTNTHTLRLSRAGGAAPVVMFGYCCCCCCS